MPWVPRPGYPLAVALLIGAVIVPSVACAQGLPPADPYPAGFTRAWQDGILIPGTNQKAALADLAATTEWEPYLRASLNRTTDQTLRDRVRPVLTACQKEWLAWNLQRAKGWAADLRFDNLTTLGAAIDDAEAAAALGQLILTAQARVHDTFKTVGNWGELRPPKTRAFVNQREFAQFAGKDGFTRLSGDRASIRDAVRPAMIHVRGGQIQPNIHPHSWICLTDQQLAEMDEIRGIGWHYSVVCVNDNARFQSLSGTLVVCDGNVDLIGARPIPGSCRGSVVIANGDISTTDELELDGSSFVYAAGDFLGSKERWKWRCSVVTGGKNVAIPDFTDPERKKYEAYFKQHFREGVKENPFGVKFVSPADVGIELAVTDDDVRLGSLQPTSPVAKAGLVKGDRILSLNGVKMTSAADFRRQLRESLVWATGLFEVQRGSEKFFKLVRFAEPPKRP
jgi:hypothetical protein